MDPDTFRGDVGVEGADVYWRRRVSVLTGMLVVVAVVAWACTGASGKQEGAEGGKVTPRPGDTMVVALPTPLASRMPAANGPSVPPVPGLLPPSGSALPSPEPSKPAKPRRPGDPCDAKDLVIALQSGQDVYGKGAVPRFLLTVVSTGRVECTVDVGPRTLEMRVMSGGERVWSTADCVSGAGVDTQTLQRGVPYVRTIQWDRHRSGTDCSSKRPAAAPGTYVAAAREGQLRSPKVAFHLR
ncbi:hypothetical protein [Planotetraspora sp. GP83]|uniref:hypothetical protein n=1 Tax=Planotetraspora sp. GP83 TaxID=3156264 RepID=UPI0035127534